MVTNNENINHYYYKVIYIATILCTHPHAYCCDKFMLVKYSSPHQQHYYVLPNTGLEMLTSLPLNTVFDPKALKKQALSY